MNQLVAIDTWRRRWKPSLILLAVTGVLALLLGTTSRRATAGTGTIYNSLITKAGPDRFSVSMDTRWCDGNGYRPVRGILSCNLPASRDYRLTLRVVVVSDRGNRGKMVFDTPLLIEKGQTSVDFETRVLQLETAEWNVSLLEDGVQLGNVGVPVAHSGKDQWTEIFPSILFLDSDAPLRRQDPSQILSDNPAERSLPDFRALAGMFPQNGHYGLVDGKTKFKNVSDNKLFDELRSTPKYQIIALQEAPRDPLGYSCIDMVVISIQDLERFRTEYDSSWSILRSHIHRGATLIVLGTTADELNALLEMPAESLDWVRPPSPEFLDNSLPFTKFTRWRNLSLNREKPHGWNELIEGMQTPMSVYVKHTIQERRGLTSVSIPNSEQMQAHIADFGLGHVVAIVDAELLPGHLQEWDRILRGVGQSNWMWYRRNGLSARAENDGYYKMLVPGVGAAPVMTFLFGISLFVIVIGPVNYVGLRHVRRLPWLLFTVPLGASAVTFTLITFSLLDDGLSTRVRMRSLTVLDTQENGKSLTSTYCWQSYYAGFAPSTGLSYPRDITVYPINDHEVDGKAANLPTRRFVWNEESLQLRNGFLQSRVPMQLMLTRTRTSDLRVAVKESNGRLMVRNELSVPIELLYIKDDKGVWHVGRQIEQDDRAVLVQNSRAALTREILADRGEAFLSYPAGYSRKARARRRGSTSRLTVNRAMQQFGLDQDILGVDTNLDSLLQLNLHNALTLSDNLPKRTYIAFVGTCLEIPAGLECGPNEASVHIVRGRY